MSWRTILITRQSKLSYKNGYLVVRNEEAKMIHLSEINTLLIDSTDITFSVFLFSELMKNKIKIVLCDEQHNPQGEVVPYYGKFNGTKAVQNQVRWIKEDTDLIWTDIIYQKILNQSIMLKKLQLDNSDKLVEYLKELKIADSTNREGHAAKVYFNTLFGKGFSRDKEIDINAALNYGYSIILSNFNKEIVSLGYLTQIGMKHINEFNYFNLSCDIMEPFRVLVDEVVYRNLGNQFDNSYKVILINLLNEKLRIDGKEHFLTNAIQIYVRSVFNAIEQKDVSLIKYFEFV